MYRRLVVVSFLLGFCFSVQGQQEYLDADNEGEALGMILGGIETNRHFRQACSEWFPDIKRQLDAHFYIWEKLHLEEITAANHMLKAVAGPVDEQMAELKKMARGQVDQVAAYDDEKRRNACITLAQMQSSEERHMRRTTPRASKYLLDYLAENPLTETEWQVINLRAGCITGGLNGGGVFETVQSYCDCMASSILNGMSMDEVKEFNRVANERGTEAALNLPQFVSIRPQLEQCAADAQ